MADNPFTKREQKNSSPIYTNDDISSWLKSGSTPAQSSICALLVGHPKVGKTGVALDCRSEESKAAGRKIIAFELNSDNGCEINRREFHNNDPNIIVLNLREYSMDEQGDYQPDYIKTMAKIKSTLQYIKNNIESLNTQAIVFDGIDIFLSEICESQMRLDEHIDVTGGVSMRFWKKRNDYYFKVINMLLDIDVDKYFICHYSDRRKNESGIFDDSRQLAVTGKNLVYNCQKTTPDKMHQIVEFQDKSKIVDGKKQVKIVATVVADRTNLENHLREFVVAETIDDKVVWHGLPILRR